MRVFGSGSVQAHLLNAKTSLISESSLRAD
jgi:hypothetical protein